MATTGLLVAIARTTLTFRDVRAIAEARREARTDELTGLANRRAFNENLARALRGRPQDRPLALLIADLDDFKTVNDTLGHHHGDELLTLVAPRLHVGLRSNDLLARIGGDEFAVVLDGAGPELAGQVAAMYDAKASSGGQGFYHPEYHRAGRERHEAVERLRHAIEAGQLVLHYQPQVALATGEVVGVEALVRWEHPTSGLQMPAAFLPQAESGGLMRLLTLNVLEQAVRRCAGWMADGHRVRVAVNLSVNNLLDVEFPQQVELLLQELDVPGRLLVLELTEDLFMADPARGEKVVAGLQGLGIEIVVDDYGTGYSSLSYLRDLRTIAGLKLDRSFVTHLDSDPRAQAIVESTIALAGSLGLELVAEGVETEAVRDRLAALGCEYAQGYLFSRPLPAEALQLGVIESARAAR